MSDKPTIPAPQYTLFDALSTCLALAQRALAEVRALARLPGPPGPRGERGPAGEKGERGIKGEQGRNAADLPLLQQDIKDEIVRVIKAATMTSNDGGRTLLWTVADTTQVIKTDMPLDAGVWRADRNYKCGDTVTFGGSIFIAQQDTDTKPETEDSHWRLSVKRGRDGKDGKPGERGAAGPRGERGETGARSW